HPLALDQHPEHQHGLHRHRGPDCHRRFHQLSGHRRIHQRVVRTLKPVAGDLSHDRLPSMTRLTTGCLLLLLLGGYAWQQQHFLTAPVSKSDNIPTAGIVSEPPASAFAWKTATAAHLAGHIEVTAVAPIVTEPPASEEEARLQLAALAKIIPQMGTNEVITRLQNLSPDELRGDPGKLLVRRWAELDPTAAAAWTTRLTDTESRQELSVAVALVWSGNDMPAALAWAHSLPADD